MGASNVQNFGGLINYSTDEQVVGTWIDGKPVYQKTFNNLNLNPTYNNWVDVCTIPNLGLIIGYNIIGHAENSINLTGAGLEVFNSKNGTNGTVKIEYSQNVNIRSINIVTLQYTKTTD